MTACISSVYQTQVSLPKVESYYRRDHWFVERQRCWFWSFWDCFSSTSVVDLCSRRPRRVKTNRGRAGTSTSVCEPSTSTEQGGYINYDIWRTLFVYEEDLSLLTEKTTTTVFVRREKANNFVRRPKSVHRQIFESRQLSKIISLSLLDRRVLAKGLSHARDWNNFWSRGTDSRGTWPE